MKIYALIIKTTEQLQVTYLRCPVSNNTHFSNANLSVLSPSDIAFAKGKSKSNLELISNYMETIKNDKN